MINLKEVYKTDPEIAKAMEQELLRQQNHIGHCF